MPPAADAGATVRHEPINICILDALIHTMHDPGMVGGQKTIEAGGNRQITRIARNLSRDVGLLGVSRMGDADPSFKSEWRQSQIGPVLISRLRGVRIERDEGALRDRWGDRVLLNVQRLGTTQCWEGGNELSAGAGDVVLVDPCLASSVGSIGTSTFLTFAIPRAKVAVLKARGLSPLHRVIRGDTSIGRMLLGTLNLLTARHDDDPRTERLAQGMVWDMLIAALEAQHVAADEPDALLLQRMSDWTRSRAEIGGGGTRELARAFALSERSLYRFFARQDTTPDRWMWQQRLELAREYLCAPRATVSGVAIKVGFKDLSHFSRSFHRAFGLPPSAYRSQVQVVS